MQVVRRPRFGHDIGDKSSEMQLLRSRTPMIDAVIDEIRGRQIRVGSRWLTDFASCNYLGFDLNEEIMASIDPQVRRWGTHPSWSRLLGNPRPYIEIEERLSDLLGAPDALVLPTITHIHSSVIPALVGTGTVFVDRQAHKTIYDGCRIARGQGAMLQRFRTDDLDDLGRQLHDSPAGTRLVCVDGLNSMTGNVPDVPGLARLCREHDAQLYVDDAHGFGVIGERRPAETSPYGARGNSVVRHCNETYDSIILVGGFSKAYSSLLAFIALPTRLKEHLKHAAAPYLYSGPSPTASLATVLAGFDVNERHGDAIRADLHRKAARVLAHVRGAAVLTPNTSPCSTPIIELPLARGDDLPSVARLLWENGVYVTLAAYPLVPRDQVGFRIQVTAANTNEEIDHLIDVLNILTERSLLRPAAVAHSPADGLRSAARVLEAERTEPWALCTAQTSRS